MSDNRLICFRTTLIALRLSGWQFLSPAELEGLDALMRIQDDDYRIEQPTVDGLYRMQRRLWGRIVFVPQVPVMESEELREI